MTGRPGEPPGPDAAEPPLAAGVFSTWLVDVQAAIDNERPSLVPCDGCTACCTAFQFVTIEPDETDTLAHIPPALLFPVPGAPAGHVLLGHDQHGHCPMLVDGRCSIYEHRPRACQAYDCRVFPAAGLDADRDDDRRAPLARRAGRWRFSFPADADRQQFEAVHAAARFLREKDGATTTTTRLAVRAIEIHRRFLAGDDECRPGGRS